mgnify:CR=1 FL=1
MLFDGEDFDYLPGKVVMVSDCMINGVGNLMHAMKAESAINSMVLFNFCVLYSRTPSGSALFQHHFHMSSKTIDIEVSFWPLGSQKVCIIRLPLASTPHSILLGYSLFTDSILIIQTIFYKFCKTYELTNQYPCLFLDAYNILCLIGLYIA